MAKRKKVVDIIKTVILLMALIFFVVIAVCQIYENMNEDNGDDRIVLGVNSANSETFGSALNGISVPVGDYVGIVSGGNFMVIDKEGDAKNTENFMLSDPILHSRGDYCIVADYNGKEAKLYEKGKVTATVETEEKIISVVTNRNGFFAIATEEVGYNAVVNVYRKNGTPIYRYRITENIFIDMDISNNNRKLIVTEANLDAAKAGSMVVEVALNVSDSQKAVYVPEEMYIGIHFNSNSSFVALGSHKTDLYRSDMKLSATIDYEGRTLITSDITTDDMICLAFRGSGEEANASVLEIYDKNGKKRGSVSFEEEIENISVTGSYVAVCHGDMVDIVKSNGTRVKTFSTTSPVKCATAFPKSDAAVIFSGGNTTIMK